MYPPREAYGQGAYAPQQGTAQGYSYPQHYPQQQQQQPAPSYYPSVHSPPAPNNSQPHLYTSAPSAPMASSPSSYAPPSSPYHLSSPSAPTFGGASPVLYGGSPVVHFPSSFPSAPSQHYPSASPSSPSPVVQHHHAPPSSPSPSPASGYHLYPSYASPGAPPSISQVAPTQSPDRRPLQQSGPTSPAPLSSTATPQPQSPIVTPSQPAAATSPSSSSQTPQLTTTSNDTQGQYDSSTPSFAQGIETAVVLCSHHGRFLKIDGLGGVKADGKDPRQPSATWRMTITNSLVTFKASDGTYLSSDMEGKISMERRQPTDAERFKARFSPLQSQQCQTVVLTSNYGKFLCAERSGKVIADRTKAKSFERWQIQPAVSLK